MQISRRAWQHAASSRRHSDDRRRHGRRNRRHRWRRGEAQRRRRPGHGRLNSLTHSFIHLAYQTQCTTMIHECAVTARLNIQQ